MTTGSRSGDRSHPRNARKEARASGGEATGSSHLWRGEGSRLVAMTTAIPRIWGLPINRRGVRPKVGQV